MIRLCDKEIYKISLEQADYMDFDVFFEENPDAVIGVVDSASDEFISIIYKYVDDVRCENAVTCRVVLCDNFWDVCRFVLNVGDCRLVSVYNTSNELIGFAYEDGTSSGQLDALKSLAASPHAEEIFQLMYPGIEQIYIWGCNEAAYYLLRAVQKTNIVYTLLGEEWKWFGFDVMQHFNEKMTNRSFYMMAEGIGYHCENSNDGVSMYPAVTTFPPEAIISASAYSFACSESKKYLESKKIPYVEVTIPIKKSVENYITELERESLECKAVPPYAYISQRIDGCYNGNRYHEKILWDAYGKNNLESLIEEKSDHGNRGKIIVENPYISLTKTKNGLHRLYVIGRCIVYGMGCVTPDQLTTRLQSKLDREYPDYEVVAVGIPANLLWKLEDIIKTLPVRNGDLICFVDEESSTAFFAKTSLPYNPIVEIYKEKDREDYFFGCPIHSTPKGNDALAEFIYGHYLEPELRRISEIPASGYKYLQKGEVVSKNLDQEIKKYIQGIKAENLTSGRVGAIVMNANPFTKGHLHLAEYAAGVVDWLYIFVVEEDKSEIGFEYRYDFVRHGVRHIENAIVVPSGSMIISAKTLAVYFEKENIQEETIDAGYDLEIFARYIAPALNISVRFVGEEPSDRVTAQYNEQMKQILPEFGIELVEIPRKKNSDGDVISAGQLRRLLKGKNYKEAQKYVDDWELERLKEIYAS